MAGKYRRNPNWCDKCDKRFFPSKELAQKDLDSRKIDGRVYDCGKYFHITSVKKYNVCQEVSFSTIGHAIDGMKLMRYFPDGSIPNVAPCRRKTHWHLGYTPWHIVPLKKGVLSKTRVLHFINPRQLSKKKAKKERSSYRVNNLPKETWENEGGALYVPWHAKENRG